MPRLSGAWRWCMGSPSVCNLLVVIGFGVLLWVALTLLGWTPPLRPF